ncbi:eukaryotic translation initiation factor 4B1-like [Olea europaea var. sylvestris]|uniref:eukaryotic translation initiation factor 4B1-like n=1 Tax=Olea europaea var. sylvestris TaxID=158386 RepID=UPI000C1CE25E|nr:eukaryotic translation initiation factor 4B1-like [Olea europaea var. sylvestris]
MSKSPWKNIGDWAAESERAEAEEREQAEQAAAAAQAGGGNFPSLKEAVNTKQKKKTKMSLHEFTMQPSYGSGSAPPSRGLTQEEMFRLPTRPRERPPDEMQHGRLGEGFPSYGNRPGSGYGDGYSDRPTREFENRRSYGGFEDENRRGPTRVSGFDQQTSRADGVDNWASGKKALPDYTSGPAGRPARYSSLGGSSDGISRADEVDSWVATKKPFVQSQPPQQARSSGFGRLEPDRWTRNEGERQRLVLDPTKSDRGGDADVLVKVNKSNPFGAARPREEVLAEKGLDWKKMDIEIEVKKQQHSVGSSRPTSSQSSRPGSTHSSRSESLTTLQSGMAEGAAKQTPKMNPFGDAKPREVLLEQKGLDWRKIDLELEHRLVERPETEEENSLKEEIEHLKKEFLEKSGEEQSCLQDLILKREKDLELLRRELDDKVRYSQKVFERPGSGAGRDAISIERPSRLAPYEEPRAGFPERPPSRPGAHEDPRAGHSERPRSRPGLSEKYRPGFPERPSRPGLYEESRSVFTERPSGSGSYEETRAGFSEKSPSLSQAYQDPRAVDYMERPRSRGTVNSRTRPIDDRKASQGGGVRGFVGSRDVDRSRPRW